MIPKFGHQTPNGSVLIWTGEKFEELKMIKRYEVEEFLNTHKKLSPARKKALLDAIGGSNEKKDPPKRNPRSELPKMVKDPARKSISLQMIQDHEGYSVGTIVRLEGKYYRRGKTLWIPVKPQ